MAPKEKDKSGGGSATAQHGEYFEALKSPAASSAPNGTPSRARGGLPSLSATSSSDLQTTMRLRLRKQSTRAMPFQQAMFKQVKRSLHLDKARSAFWLNLHLALRIAIGVLIAGIAQTHSRDYRTTRKVSAAATNSTSNPTNHSEKIWLFLPSDYYLGGLYYAAMMVIFAAARNIGGTIQQIIQISCGVGIALGFNLVLFSILPLSHNHLIKVTASLSGTNFYFISLQDLAVFVPFLVVFTIVLFILPLDLNVQKFAVGTNLYFMLTILSPMNPIYPGELKSVDDSLIGTSNLIRNLAIYSIVGAIGTFITLVTMFLPYPIFAVKQLQDLMDDCKRDICEILNLLMDSYCFRTKDIKEMDFFRLKLSRLLQTSSDNQKQMLSLLQNTWWEEIVGFGLWFRFNKTICKQFIKLHGNLIKDLVAMQSAMELESCVWFHQEIMQNAEFQSCLYKIQVQTNDLLDEISLNVKVASRKMQFTVQSQQQVQTSLENLMVMYVEALRQCLQFGEFSDSDQLGKSMPMSFFLYSLNAFVQRLLVFEQVYNKKNYSSRYRMWNFFKRGIVDVLMSRKSYPWPKILFALRTSLAVLIGVIFGVFFFAFSSTVPSAIAMVATNRKGGTYGRTINRVGGLVAGSVLPSIFQFFICKIDNNYAYNVLNNLVIFFWQVPSMYVYFDGQYALAGMVSAFVSVSVLMQQNVCPGEDQGVSLSYSSLTQNSLGILILLICETLIAPKSARDLLRSGIQNTLEQAKQAFGAVFAHHLCSERSDLMPLNASDLREWQETLGENLPNRIEEQFSYLKEADMEPALWRPGFCQHKYAQVLLVSKQLIEHLRIMLELTEWHSRRKYTCAQPPAVGNLNKGKLRESEQSTRASLDLQGKKTLQATHLETGVQAEWRQAQEDLEQSVTDTLETLEMLYSDDFSYSDADENAIFMQMKEAFRKADVDRSGEVDADELIILLENLVPYAASSKLDMQEYVHEFMKLVDADGNGRISFAEFMNALDHGFHMELEIYEKKNVKQTLLRTVSNRGLSGRDLEEGGGGRRGSLLRKKSTLTRMKSRSLRQSQRQNSLRDSYDSTGDVVLLEPTFFHTQQVGGGAGGVKFMDQTKALTDESGSSRPSMDSMLRASEVFAADDLLNVESFTIKDTAANFKRCFGECFLDQVRSSIHGESECEWRVSMERFVLMSCVICGLEEVAANLTELNALAVT